MEELYSIPIILLSFIYNIHIHICTHIYTHIYIYIYIYIRTYTEYHRLHSLGCEMRTQRGVSCQETVVR